MCMLRHRNYDMQQLIQSLHVRVSRRVPNVECCVSCLVIVWICHNRYHTLVNIFQLTTYLHVQAIGYTNNTEYFSTYMCHDCVCDVPLILHNCYNVTANDRFVYVTYVL